MQQQESSSAISAKVTDANFAVKQYQVMVEELKQEIGTKLRQQPKSLQREVEVSLARFAEQEAALDAQRRADRHTEKLTEMEQQRKENAVKAQIKR